MAGTVERTLAEWLIVALILFTLVVDALLHKLDKWIEKNQLRLSKLISNLYKEIMVLGLVSFGFIMYIFAASPGQDVKMTFEVAHIFIFLFAIFHTIIVVCAILISLGYSRHWKKMEHMKIKEYIEDKNVFQNINDIKQKHSNFVWHKLFWWMPHPSMVFVYRKVHERLAFHDTRFQFIKYKNLDENFPFARYLRSLKYITFVDLVEIHWTHYCFFLIVVLLDIARGPWRWHPNFEPIFLICTSLLNMVFVVILAVKIRKIYFTMLKEPAIYFEDENYKPVADGVSVEVEPVETNQSPESGDEKSTEESLEGNEPVVETTTLGTFINFGFTLNDLLWRRSTVEQAHSSPDNLVNSSGANERVTQRTPSSNVDTQNIGLRTMRSMNIFKSRSTNRRANSGTISCDDESDNGDKLKSTTKFPRWFVAIVPRLGRVPTTGEKLFWFGWHKFYIWCVEAVLFFTTVNVSTTIAILILQAKGSLGNRYYTAPKLEKKLYSDVKNSTIACEQLLHAVSTEKSLFLSADSSLMILALAIGVIALVFVLFHVAGIMKKYIFVMNNAQILPREEIEAAIRDVGYQSGHKSESSVCNPIPYFNSLTIAGSEIESVQQVEVEDDRMQLRKQMTKYMERNNTGAVSTNQSASRNRENPT